MEHRTRSASLRAALALAVLVAAPGALRANPSTTPEPLPGLSADQLRAFDEGRALFEHLFTVGEGLGPFFNAQGCSQCHSLANAGGGYPADRSLVYGASFEFAGRQYFEPTRGLVARIKSIKGVPPEAIPGMANAFGFRRTPQLYGLGMIEAIPDEELERIAAENGGRIARGADGRIRRWGSQNQVTTLFEFVQVARETEIGLTARELSRDADRRLWAFLALLDHPPRDVPAEIADQVEAGRELFDRIGCASCHVPTFTTGDGPIPVDGIEIAIRALQGVEFHPYSDFLLHDLGPEVAGALQLGGAGRSEFRTAPLWGRRFRKDGMLHDGQAQRLEHAILAHGGEAAASRDVYLSLLAGERDAVIKFLSSL